MRAVVQFSSRALGCAFAAAKQARAAQVGPRRLIVCEGERQQQGETSTAQAPPAAAAPSVRMPGGQRRPPMPPPSPYSENLKIERVEERGESRFSGVVALDSGNAANDWGRVALLVGGDAAALLLFATIGRVSHGETISLAAALSTAWPFMAGFFASGALLGGYGKAAQGGNTAAAAGAAAKSWALGIPAGVLLRSATRGYFPEPSFVAVSMVATGVFLIGWRSGLAAATPVQEEPQTRQDQLKSRQDRQGGPFEMIKMVLSMVKRW